MSSKNTAAFGIHASGEHAERAVDSVIAAGYPSSSISVLLPDTRSTREFAHEKDTKAPEGTAAGATAGGAVGGWVGALIGMGIPEYEAKRYEGRVKGGGTLLSVHCHTAEQIARVKDLLKGAGATDIASTGESAGDKTGTTRVA